MVIAERLWKKSKVAAFIILFISGFMFAGKLPPEWWVLGGSVAGVTLIALYYFVLRYNMLYVPIIATVVTILDASRYLLADPAVLSFPDSIIRIIIGIAAGVISVWGLYRIHLLKRRT
jgi:hypothetical protein